MKKWIKIAIPGGEHTQTRWICRLWRNRALGFLQQLHGGPPEAANHRRRGCQSGWIKGGRVNDLPLDLDKRCAENLGGSKIRPYGRTSIERDALAKPLRVHVGAVEVVSGFVPFELAVLRGLRAFLEQRGDFRLTQRLEVLHDVDRLLQNRK
jgi:hypothetical protein